MNELKKWIKSIALFAAIFGVAYGLYWLMNYHQYYFLALVCIAGIMLFRFFIFRGEMKTFPYTPKTEYVDVQEQANA